MEGKFGADGWRGRIARDFTFENIRGGAQAIADFMKSFPNIPSPRGPVAVLAR